MGNSYGTIFRLTTFGESHGGAIGGVIDGCPAGIEIDTELIQQELDRRKPGQSEITTQRKETDEIEILSGIFEGKSLGTPIGFIIRNTDPRSKDYSHIETKFRPSHADFTYQEKYGIRDYRGGGRSSARETAMRVAAGAIAKLALEQLGVKIHGYVSKIGEITAPHYTEMDLGRTEENIVRCPDPVTAEAMIELVKKTRKDGDSIGGMVTAVISGVPAGLGEPVFDRFHAELGKAMLSINAVKGFQYGSGFASTGMKGSEHNDEYYTEGVRVRTRTNRSGGIQGGITNGEDIYFDVAFKPVATIMKEQQSVDEKGESTTVSGRGRHDPCVVPRAVPIVEAMAALVTFDFYLRNQTAKFGG